MNENDNPVKGRILLIDDEESIRLIGKMMLERLGYDTIIVPGGREAISIFQDQYDKIDLVILDLTMPQMDGKQTYHELIKINPSVRIIISSGYNAPDLQSEFSAGGLVGFIQKPFTLHQLAGKIQAFMEIKP